MRLSLTNTYSPSNVKVYLGVRKRKFFNCVTPKDNDSEIAAKLQEIKAEALNALSGYSQRQTKLTASVLVKLLVVSWLEKPDGSLRDVVSSGRQMGITVSEQRLQSRLDKRAVMLMAGVFQASLGKLHSSEKLRLPLLEQFSAVQILDSTQVRVPTWFGSEFYHKSRQYSGIKLHLVFDYLHGQLEALEMTNAHAPDQCCDIPQHVASPKSLWLFDLGYFSQDTLQALALRQAYFVCRLQSQTALFTPAGERLSLAQTLKACTTQSLQMEVRLGIKY